MNLHLRFSNEYTKLKQMRKATNNIDVCDDSHATRTRAPYSK